MGVRAKVGVVVLAAVVASLVGLVSAGSAWAAPPPNDNFANATVIGSLPFSATEDTTGATEEPLDAEVATACGVSVPIPQDYSVWFDYTPTTSQLIQIDASASSYTVGIGVVTGSPGSFQAAACFAPVGQVSVTAGQTYHILAVDFGGGTGGTLQLSVSVAQPPPPPPTVHVAINPFGAVETSSGAATIRGRVECTGSTAGITIEVAHEVGHQSVVGFGSTDVTCDGTSQPWSITVTPPRNKFGVSTAVVYALARTCNPQSCASVLVKRTVELRRGSSG